MHGDLSGLSEQVLPFAADGRTSALQFLKKQCELQFERAKLYS